MGSRILHFGQDDCNRLTVLRSAGYAVELCPSLSNLDSALHNDGDPAAIVMSDVQGDPPRQEAVTLVHSQSSAALILFRHTDYAADERDFDLIIPNLTPVREWLDKIAATIEQSHVLHASSIEIRHQAESLIRETEIVRQKSIRERQRSAEARSRAKEILNTGEEDPDPTGSD